jgi:shikimate dehydrogenase
VAWAEHLDKEVEVMELGHIAEALDGADLLVNATSVGMSPAVDVSLVPAGLLAKVPVVFDVVYNPVKTRLLKEAEAAGAQTISGLDMLVWQAALAFEMWTRNPAPFNLMRQTASKLLERYEN